MAVILTWRRKKATAYDATLEYYFRHNGFVEVAVYRKDITNRIVNGATRRQSTASFTTSAGPATWVAPRSRRGVERADVLRRLPGALSGFGVFGNYTLAKSTINTAGDPLRGYELQGVSKNSFNAGLLYEKYRLSGRLAYTYRSSTTTRIARGGRVRCTRLMGRSSSNYVRPNGRLDFAIELRRDVICSVGIDGTNLPRRHYQSYYNLALEPS